MQIIFLDHNATTKIAPQALAKMNEIYQFPYNNSSTHQLGRQAASFVEAARRNLRNLLNAQNYEITFSSSSTEATNNVMFGTSCDKILFCGIEHSSVFNCRPEHKKISEIAALTNGLIDVNDLKNQLEKLENANFLVSVMLANNETGAIQPITEIAKLVHQKGGLLHCDIVQAVGKIAVDLEKLNVDFASISAHKINGPQGVGALLTRKGLEIKPLIFGGKQEKSKRAGTVNVAGVVGFGVACELAAQQISQYQNVQKLRDFLESEVSKIAGDDVKIFSQNVPRLPNTSYIALKNVSAQTQLINFDLNGICVSAGPACSSGTTSEESRILKAMNIAPEFSKSAIRVSLGKDTALEEIKKFIAVWQEFYQKTKG